MNLEEEADLIRLEERLKSIHERLGILQKHPLVCPLVDLTRDHEKRIRLLERAYFITVGAVLVIQTLGVWKIWGVLPRYPIGM